MRPIVLKVDADGKLMISADEIEKMVNEAYEEGFAAGKASTPALTTTPSYPWITPIWLQSDRPLHDHITITCCAE